MYVESQRALCLVSLLIFLGSYPPYRTMYLRMLSEHISFHMRDFRFSAFFKVKLRSHMDGTFFSLCIGLLLHHVYCKIFHVNALVLK